VKSKTLKFPLAETITLNRANEATAENKELRRFLEAIQMTTLDNSVRQDRMEATLNTILRELKKILK